MSTRSSPNWRLLSHVQLNPLRIVRISQRWLRRPKLMTQLLIFEKCPS